jgi:hypothetical protein
MDLASIILSQSPYRSRAISEYGAAKRQRYARQEKAIGDFGQTLGEIPGLLRRKQEEDEIKGFDSTVLGSLSMDGDPSSARRAASIYAKGLKTPGGIQHALGRTLQFETLAEKRRGTALQREIMRAEEKRRVEDQAAQQAERDLKTKQRGAMVASGKPMVAFGSLPGVPAPIPTLRAPEIGERLDRLAATGLFGEEMIPAMERDAARKAVIAKDSLEAKNKAAADELKAEKAKTDEMGVRLLAEHEGVTYVPGMTIGNVLSMSQAKQRQEAPESHLDRPLTPEEALFLGHPEFAGQSLRAVQEKRQQDEANRPPKPLREPRPSEELKDEEAKLQLAMTPAERRKHAALLAQMKTEGSGVTPPELDALETTVRERMKKAVDPAAKAKFDAFTEEQKATFLKSATPEQKAKVGQ